MRICHLSKGQELILSGPSRSPIGYPKCHKLFMLLNFNTLKNSQQTSQALCTRNIILESSSLPFQAHAKLFHAPPPKKFQKKK